MGFVLNLANYIFLSNLIRAAELRFSFYVSDLTRPPEDSEKKLETPTNLEILSDNLNIFYKQ